MIKTEERMTKTQMQKNDQDMQSKQGLSGEKPQGLLVDGHGRIIDYLRISLTDRCNLRCRYCMPPGGVPAFAHEDILTLEETCRIASILVKMGIRKIRLTGGEPLIRKNMMSLVQRLSDLAEKPELALTTNGVLLEDYLEGLKAAQLSHLNISLDTRNREVFKNLTGVDAYDQVERSIRRAVDMGMKVRINSVLIRGINDGEAADLAMMARELPVDLRFIELMPIGCGAAYRGVSRDEILSQLQNVFDEAASCNCEDGESSTNTESDERAEGIGRGTEAGKDSGSMHAESGNADAKSVYSDSHGPAEYVTFPGFVGRIGFISPLSHAFCERCNRIRLTTDGKLKLCLFYPDGTSLLPMMRQGCSDEEIRDAVFAAIQNKPLKHGFGKTQAPVRAEEKRNMVQIGG